MPVKAVAKKNEKPAQAPQSTQAQPGAKQEAAPRKQQKEAPRKALVATAPVPKAHHATLSETKCADCAVGLLKRYASESLRNQKKVDPANQQYHLQDDEEIELLRTEPLTLQMVGLRRERSLSNRFDDLLVVLYDPALLKEGEQTVLDAEGLRKENLESTQAYVDAIAGASTPAAPKGWPLPGTDVSCKQCGHWRVLVYPITTEPGYDPHKPSIKDAKGHKLPDFDNLTLLPEGVATVAPGIYNEHYRVGLHKGTRNPPTSFAALQLVPWSIPVRRRYPIVDFLKAAQAAYHAGTDDKIRKALIKQDAKAQQEEKAKIEAELGKKLPRKSKAEKKAFAKAVQARLDAMNRETYKPRIAEHRKAAATDMLAKLKAKSNAKERFIRLENAGGAETQNFETAGNEVSHLEIADDDQAPMKVCVQLVFKAPPPPPPAATAIPAAVATPPAPPPGPRTLKLTEDDVLVTFGTAAGTNLHRSTEGERGAWSRDREVNNWSEGCQVFRSPHDFSNFMRMAMLAKRAHCSSRSARCCAELKVEDVEQGIGAQMTTYIERHLEEFSTTANDALKDAFTPPAPKPPPTPAPNAVLPDLKVRAAIEKLVGESKAYKNFNNEVRSTFRAVFPTKKKEVYAKDDTFALMTSYTREKVLAALNEKSSEPDVKKAIAAGLEDYRKKLTETKAAWIKDEQTRQVERKHTQFLAQGMESCDFGDCGFRFDYLLAETSRANMEAFVAKLGDHSWSALFPEDAPPPPPKKPKTPAPSKPAVAVNKPPAK